MRRVYYLHCVETGEEVRVRGEGGTTTWPDEPWVDFFWTDGNFACNCNRHIEFNRAKGYELTDEEHEALQCGDGRYSVRFELVPVTGV